MKLDVARRPLAIRYLVFWLTTDCNARCHYCYRGDVHVSRVISMEIVDAALNLAAQSGESFHVQLAGGEPTLVPDMISRIGARVRGLGLPATMALQTNGALVDAALIDTCRRHAIGIGMSIDGPPAVQERIRGLAGATFRGLALLSEANAPVHVTSVLSDANVDHLSSLALTLAAYGNVTGFGLDVLVRKGRAALQGPLLPKQDRVVSGVLALLEALEEIRRRRDTELHWRELDEVRNALARTEPPVVFCHACRGESLAVHPDGAVYPCAQNVGDPAAAVGTVFNVDWNRLQTFYAHAVLRGACSECSLSGRCPGDCPSRIRYNQGRPDGTVCAIYRTIAAALIQRRPQ